MGNYDDIIHLPHYRSRKRRHMSMQDRAAQFSPFAALTGFEEATEESGRITDPRTEMEEYGKMQLDQAIQQLQELLPLHPCVSITYFIPDAYKAGGACESVYGQVRKIDVYRQVLVLMDGQEISLPDILRMECSAFVQQE